jgi:hypothetical protein
LAEVKKVVREEISHLVKEVVREEVQRLYAEQNCDGSW